MFKGFFFYFFVLWRCLILIWFENCMIEESALYTCKERLMVALANALRHGGRVCPNLILNEPMHSKGGYSLN